MGRSKASFWKVVLAGIFCAYAVSTVANHYWVSYQVDRDVTRLRAIVDTLARDDAGYGELRVVRTTHPKAYIFGTLQTASQQDALRSKVAESFGDAAATRIMSPVRLAVPATPPGRG